MSRLFGTHILIWTLLDPVQIRPTHQKILRDAAVRKYISVVSLWEISLKFGIGKLGLGGHAPEKFIAAAQALGFGIKSPVVDTFAPLYRLRIHDTHQDLFDRMLI